MGVAAIFGDGSNGDDEIDSDVELTRDVYFDDLAIHPGVTLDPAGFRIFVAGTLTLGEGSEIARNGFPGSASEGGGGLGSGSLGGSGSGGGGGSGPSGAGVTDSLGGDGGDGAGGTSGGNVTPPPSPRAAGAWSSSSPPARSRPDWPCRPQAETAGGSQDGSPGFTAWLR